jgi:hypothetical protein
MRGMLGSPVGRWSGPTARPPREIALLRYELPSGNHAGSAFTSWTSLPLNTIRYDPAGIIQQLYSGGEFLLLPGRYLVKGRCPLMNVNEFEVRIFDQTRQVVACDGGSGYVYANNAYDMATALLRGELNLTCATRLGFQQRSGTNESTWGLGHGGTKGVPEVFAWLWIRKWRT